MVGVPERFVDDGRELSRADLKKHTETVVMHGHHRLPEPDRLHQLTEEQLAALRGAGGQWRRDD